VLPHPLYSTDLAPAGFLISYIKITLLGTRFEIVSSNQLTATRELRAIREEAFRSFDSLYE
jgi:transposase